MRSFLLAFAAFCSAAHAQETYKCLDKAGRVTYSNVSCERQGLRHAALVADRVSVIGWQPPPHPGPLPASGARERIAGRSP